MIRCSSEKLYHVKGSVLSIGIAIRLLSAYLAGCSAGLLFAEFGKLGDGFKTTLPGYLTESLFGRCDFVANRYSPALFHPFIRSRAKGVMETSCKLLLSHSHRLGKGNYGRKTGAM